MTESFNVGDAYIELRLRQEKLQKDNADTVQALREQESRLQGVAKKAEEAGDKSNNAFGGMVGLALKAVTVMGSVELGLGAINIASEAMSGNFEDASEALKRMPAGIGPVTQQLEALLGTLTGITAETQAWQRATQNLQSAMAQQHDTSMRNLRAEEDAIMSRLKIQQQITVLESGGGDAAARLKQQFDAQNRINDAKQAALELDRKANEIALGTAGKEAGERRERINALKEEIAERELAVKGITNPLGINQTVVENYKDATAALEIELQTLLDLQDAHAAKIQSYKQEADLIRETIPLLEKLADAEENALENSIEERKTEEQAREAEERIRAAEREAEEKMRIAEQEFTEKRRMAQEDHDEQIRLMKEAAAETERQAQEDLQAQRRVSDLEASIRQRALRLQGQDLEAEIDAINQRARQQAEQAMSERERQLIEQQRQLEIQGLLDRADRGQATSPAASISSLSAAISNLQAAALRRDDPSIAQRREQIAIAKRMADDIAVVKDKVGEEQAAAPAVGR